MLKTIDVFGVLFYIPIVMAVSAITVIPSWASEAQSVHNRSNFVLADSAFRLEALTSVARSIPVGSGVAPQAENVASVDELKSPEGDGLGTPKPVVGPPSDEELLRDHGEDAGATQASSRERGWSKTLARAEIAYQAIAIIDMAQTLECMSRTNCVEQNVFLGKRPSKLAVVGFVAATSYLQYRIVKAIAKNDRDMAKIVLFTMLAGRSLVVGLNYRELR